jgi:apolipoprotein D and lipocalin family protein
MNRRNPSPSWPTQAVVALAACGWVGGVAATESSEVQPPALQSLPSLAVQPYMGTWYQVALFPNRFQKQCASDTSATYRLLSDGRVSVLNRCRQADGRFDDVQGIARPIGRLSGEGAATQLSPAQLEVSFLPAALRWLPVGWGRYWLIQLAEDGRYAVVSEPSREYLWVLSRTPALAPADEAAIRSRLQQQGFSEQRLLRWQAHPHGPARN